MKSIAQSNLSRLTLMLSALIIFPGYAQQNYPTALTGHIVIPAETFIAVPNDAPTDAKISGKFTTASRIDTPESLEGLSAQRPTGTFLPFKGQPIQGHSGVKRMKDGTYWLITDNGAGTKANSPDFLLYLNQYQLDFQTNEAKRLKTIFLHDPDKKVPFRISYEGTEQRYLTGADFDPESFQFAGGYLWIGDEFGPYLIQADMNGKIVQVFDTIVDGKVVRSPDNPQIRTPGAPTETVRFEVKRSKGFEGMASSPDGSKLYALLEGALYDEKTQQYENIDGIEYLRILEFDVATQKWTGNSWQYLLEKNGNAIGDFNMINDSEGLIIERDNGEGVIEYQCQSATKTDDCFPTGNLPSFKRIYKVRLAQNSYGKPVEKMGYIDLLKIDDPQKRALKPLSQGKFTFPFFTIENVDVVDENHIIVGNDNNLPFSSSRIPNKADDNELILLNVGSFLTNQ
jgi:hypothetical protein